MSVFTGSVQTVSSLKFYAFFIFKVEILRISSFFMLFWGYA